jgi:hypothetical protein
LRCCQPTVRRGSILLVPVGSRGAPEAVIGVSVGQQLTDVRSHSARQACCSSSADEFAPWSVYRSTLRSSGGIVASMLQSSAISREVAATRAQRKQNTRYVKPRSADNVTWRRWQIIGCAQVDQSLLIVQH